MTAREIIDQCSQFDVVLRADGDQLVVNGPAKVIDDELIEFLRATKATLLAELSAVNGDGREF